ncbi:mothers against decapentaplegic homolog 6a isoform X2 [Hypomesus transpacificus]|uniref:mothers against decapentaplegic homolog 6a isoform X2 n=1 Tax=Hypomesus transpacificus TaxID=137520 RepID=UPI001F072EBF|nr:mothers against decapentaplegic homolog 6a isoform X2 [Hypomesus transpacificus]
MFRSKRSGLIRRLWRSRLITDRDGEDGSKRSKGSRDCSCGSNPEKIPKTGLWSITRSDLSQGTLGEACSGNLAVGNSDNGRSVMCVPEHRGAQEHENDSKTMSCCLFRERDPRPRSRIQDQVETNSCPVSEQEVKNVTYAFLKRLREKLLDVLLEAVESKGGMPSECVLVPQMELRLSGHPISPQFLLCKLYRWTDLPRTARLKALFYCQSFGMSESATVCCNPYHYSRLCGPDSPPPPYSQLSYSNEHRPLDTGTSLDSSTSDSQRFHWCSVAYWEQRTRVGRLYPAHDSSLSIFYDLPQGTGLCLGQLNGNSYHDNNHRSRSHGSSGDSSRGSCVQRTRSKIGYGIVLSQEPDGVWVYNRSQHPVFAHSPTLDLPSSRGLMVKRVMPGFSLKVFDYERSSWILKHGIEPELQEGPYDPLSVRISFAKGWGPCYSRQFITSCPCWLEVLLSKHR